MSNWVVYHKGTGTFFAIDQDVVAINVSNLDDKTFNSFFNEEDSTIADTHGKQLNDEMFDNMLGGEA